MKKLILILIFVTTATFVACKNSSDTSQKTSEKFDEYTETVRIENRLEDSITVLVNFVSEERNKNRFTSWKKLPTYNKTDSLDFVAELKANNKTYTVSIDNWSGSLEINAKNNSSATSYFISDSGQDGSVESGFWDGYKKDDKKRQSYVTGIYASSDENQICCDYQEYWQQQYQIAVKDIYSQLKL